MIGDILQPTHLLFVLVVALLVLGPKRLPEAGKALGKGIRDFRMAIGGDEGTHGLTTEMPPAPAPEVMVPPAAAPPVETTVTSSDMASEPAESPAHETEHPAETAQTVG
jgi:sec-independent protein translocase protein TatA